MNTIIYTTLIKGFGVLRDKKRALGLFEEMAQNNIPYNTVTYNSLLEVLVRCNDITTAEEIFRKMPRPDLVTFSTMIKGNSEVALPVVQRSTAKKRLANAHFDSSPALLENDNRTCGWGFLYCQWVRAGGFL